ncbi:hypothetical protein [Agrobacterium sp. SORGH_AS 787]|uniref:hypothetical protein n=1 Tax=Agrobacterium sp. SORGH_AS 787 TaxID=3041775 RepID=UPI0032B7BB9C
MACLLRDKIHERAEPRSLRFQIIHVELPIGLPAEKCKTTLPWDGAAQGIKKGVGEHGTAEAEKVVLIPS